MCLNKDMLDQNRSLLMRISHRNSILSRFEVTDGATDFAAIALIIIAVVFAMGF
jgi:hypothetical protein